MIRLEQIAKTYGAGTPRAYTAVSDIDLAIAAAGITVLAGPSGSGKTTLLALIGCMTRPSTGRIYFQDREITSLPERFLSELRRRRVGFVFQNYNLIRGIRALENIMLPALPLGEPHAAVRSRALALMAQLEIGRLADLPVQHLSGGEQQRVAIARALINQPALVIADEPTAHLDTRRSEQFMAIARQLTEKGRTVLIASHDPLVSRHPSVDRVVNLHDGRIVERPRAA